MALARHRRLVALAGILAAALALAGCGGGGRGGRDGASAAAASRTSTPPLNPAGDYQQSQSRVAFQADIRMPWTKTDFSRQVVPLREFERGGPAPNGIPPLNDPDTRAVGAAEDLGLSGSEPVISVVVHGGARAYPLRILVWHEVANDRLGGRPIVVTYCPLCNSAQVYDRRVGGRVLRFGTTGNVRGSNLVMWDTHTQSWWQQIGGEALVGSYAGTHLRPVPFETVTWSEFKRRYPDGTVLSERTGFDRPYGTTPYTGYDDPRGEPFFATLHTPRRLPALEQVAAVTAAGHTIAVPFRALERHPVAQTTVGGRPTVVFYDRRGASVLDSHRIENSRQAGVATAFDRRVAGRTLTFGATSGGVFTDRQTGSRWSLTGKALSGPLRGAQLRPLRTDDRFWFAVAEFHPHVRLVP
jgi:Protein of unknown function (DUF3179)